MSKPQILANGWDSVTPADAGWTYISFGVQAVAAGESFQLSADGQERALVPLSGTAEVTAGTQSWKLGGRRTVFDGLGWCLYLPLDTSASVMAVTDPGDRCSRSPGHDQARTRPGDA